MAAKRTPKPGSRKSKESLVGSWRFRGTGPEIKFRLKDSKKGLQASISMPTKRLSMSEPAFRAFFRFMLATFANVRPETMSERFKRFRKEELGKRRKRWHMRRSRRKYVRTNPTPKPPPPPVTPDPIQPSADLADIAAQKLGVK